MIQRKKFNEETDEFTHTNNIGSDEAREKQEKIN